MENMNTRLEQTAIEIIKKLQNAGFQAVFAGGCVRDKLLNHIPKDYDIATNATPSDIKKYFNTLPLGENFGVIVVLMNNFQFEVATFRKDGVYLDGRHPENVTFATMEEDANRRDFTINALFYDPIKNKIYDYTNGINDLKNGVIRFVGDPYKRINNDKLRLLRAIRFASKYNFTFAPKTQKSLIDSAHQIDLKKFVTPERIREELVKMFTHSYPEKALQLLYDTTLLKQILPEVANLKGVEQSKEYHPEGDVFQHTKNVLKYIAPTTIKRLGALFHDIGKYDTFKIRKGRPTFYGHENVGAELTDKIMKRLKFSNEIRNAVVHLVKNHMKFLHASKMKTSTLKKFLRDPLYLDLLELHYADTMGSNKNFETYNFCVKKKIEFANTLSIKLLTGRDLLALGLPQGSLYRKLLNMVENLQLEGKLTTKKEALEFIRNYKRG